MTVSLATGRTGCHAGWGEPAACRDSGQDANCARDLPWPRPRLVMTAEGIEYRLTGVVWHPDPNACAGPVSWNQALAAAASIGWVD